MALCRALATEAKLGCEPDDVAWVRGPGGVRGALFGGAAALVRAKRAGDPADLYLAEATLSPEGVLLELGRVHDLTQTSGVDESRPVVDGHFAAYAASADGTVTSLHALDLDGLAPSRQPELSRLQQAQVAVTNLLATGSTSGVSHHVFALESPASRVTLESLANGSFRARADSREVVFSAANGEVATGAEWVRTSPEQRAKPPSFLAWGRTIGSALVGDDPMFVAKTIAMTALDWAGRVKGSVDGQDDQAKVAEELGDLGTTVAPTFSDPEVGWPPSPLAPILSPPLAGEGKWIELGSDSFITPAAGLPPAFVTTFLRPDKDRKDVRIYVTMWDPRQIALHMQAGTVEPISATGEAGNGQIPRVPEIMRRVVGGFNGGFQAQHGEFGMQADGVLYLPPKPYAATVMELRDGSTALGSWPASQEVPDAVLSYRQNLTAIVERERFNPWGRTWWGGTPPDWKDNIHTTRSGLCITKERYIGYFWGNDTSAEALAKAMLAARCTYGVHLDMNPGMAGFEFYRVETSATWKALGRPLQADWEYEGTFKALPDFHYRARRMIRGMQQQNFPQYIHIDGRDFFYLTRRPLLPGLPIAAEAPWRTKGLPQHGFPYAMAIADVALTPERPEQRTHVVRLDPRAVRGGGDGAPGESAPTVVAFAGPSPGAAEKVLVWFKGAFVARKAGEGAPEDVHIARISKLEGSPSAAVCVQDEDGILVWAELPHGEGAAATKAVDAMLAAMGCGERHAVVGDTRIALGGTLDAAGAALPPPKAALTRLVRAELPGARPYFETTPIAPPSVWQPLQMQRVRYFPKPRVKDAGAPDDAGP